MERRRSKWVIKDAKGFPLWCSEAVGIPIVFVVLVRSPIILVLYLGNTKSLILLRANETGWVRSTEEEKRSDKMAETVRNVIDSTRKQ